MSQLPLILIDTCVLLDDPDVIVRTCKKGGIPVVTSTVLDELDYNKSGDEQININARKIIREFNKFDCSKLEIFPSGMLLLDQDVLIKYQFKIIQFYRLEENILSLGQIMMVKLLNLQKIIKWY